ncbi:MAG: hypothetical protein L0219_22475, partial [Phycisphaerales bacterium]|nr:hypothetical protein [Phycisphaerales bacterium]
MVAPCPIGLGCISGSAVGCEVGGASVGGGDGSSVAVAGFSGESEITCVEAPDSAGIHPTASSIPSTIAMIQPRLPRVKRTHLIMKSPAVLTLRQTPAAADVPPPPI